MPGPIDAAGATREPTDYVALSMDTQMTGEWTQRNPYRDANVPYLYRKFYGASRFDSILDGINREITADLTDRRRPGSSVYNSNSFPAGNSFYSYKSVQNGSEVIRVLYDGRDGNVYDATAGQNSVLFSKSAGAGAARFLGVNNELFFGDGVDQQKMMQPGMWTAASGAFSANIASIAVVKSQLGHVGPYVYFLVLTFTAAAPALIPNESCAFAGITNYTALNGQTLMWQTINPAYNLGLTGDQVAFFYGSALYADTADTGTMSGGAGISVDPGTLIRAVPTGESNDYIFMALGGISMNIIGTQATQVEAFSADIASIQVVKSRLGGHVGPYVYFLIVTFTTTAPAVFSGQACTFAGLTTYVALNGQTLDWDPSVGAYNLGLSPDQVAFYYGSALYGDTADTGTMDGAGTGIVEVFFDPTDLPNQFANLDGCEFLFDGLTVATYLNGQTLPVAVVSSTLGILTVPWAVSDTTAYEDDTGTATSGDGVTGTGAPAFDATVRSITADSGQQWKNYGPAIQSWGIAVPTLAPMIQPANGSRFWTPKTQLTDWYSVIDPNGNIQVWEAEGAGVTGRSYPNWSGPAVAGPAHTTDGTAVWYNFGQISTWSPSSPFAGPWDESAPYGVILDSNFNLQLVTDGSGGDSGSSDPTWATAIGDTTADGALTWTCLGPGVELATAAVSYAYSWHGIDGSVSTSSPPATIQGGILGPNEPPEGYTAYLTISIPSSIDSQVDQFYIWRTPQGQTPLILEDQIPNPPTTPTTVNYSELGIPDSSVNGAPALNAFITAPIAEAGNPPPVGLTGPVYHMGRTWGFVGNIVYNSQGPDTNFNGNTAWAPIDQTAFPALVILLTPVTVANGGLLVWTTSGVYIVLGTGTAGNPFYVTVYEPSVNISSWTGLSVLGATQYFMESNGKVSSFDPSNGYAEIGFPVGDQFEEVTTGGITAALYNPATVFLTWNVQSSGETAMYVADGAVGWFRMAAISPPESGLCWSPRAAIVEGTSAVQSIETSPGEFNLLIAPANAGPILMRDTTKTIWTDNGTGYPAWDAKGVIRLCESGQVAEVAHIATKSAAVGARPIISILMDEVEPSEESPWDVLDPTSQDPPDLAASVSVYSDRYVAMQNGETAKGDSVLIKFDYGSQDAADELLVFSIYGRKHEERVQQ